MVLYNIHTKVPPSHRNAQKRLEVLFFPNKGLYSKSDAYYANESVVLSLAPGTRHLHWLEEAEGRSCTDDNASTWQAG